MPRRSSYTGLRPLPNDLMLKSIEVISMVSKDTIDSEIVGVVRGGSRIE